MDETERKIDRKKRERLYAHQVVIEKKIMPTKEGEAFINGTVTRFKPIYYLLIACCWYYRNKSLLSN